MIEGLSGAFANAGEAVWRNLNWAVERVNGRGGVRLADGRHPLELIRMEARRWGVEVVETEIYGMIPAQALVESAAYYLQIKDFDPMQVLELKLLSGGDAE